MDKGSLLGLHLYTYGLPRSNKSKPWKTGARPSLALPCLPLRLDWAGGVKSLKCSIHKHKKGERINMWEESMECLRNNIYQFIVKDMLYKLNSK